MPDLRSVAVRPVRSGKISYEDALRNADSVNDLRLNIKLNSKEAKNRDITAGIDASYRFTRTPNMRRNP